MFITELTVFSMKENSTLVSWFLSKLNFVILYDFSELGKHLPKQLPMPVAAQ